jgi:hypothetical protein
VVLVVDLGLWAYLEVVNMGIMWNALQPIQAPGVVAQLPTVPPNQSADTLAGGLMSGIAAGQNIAINNQNMKMNDIKLRAAKQGEMDAQTLRAAAQQGEEAYLKAQMQIDPNAGQDYLLKKAQVKNTLAMASNNEAEAAGKGLDAYSKLVNIQGQLANAALAGKTPEQQQKIWEYGWNQLPEQTKKLVPQTFDQNTAIASLTLAKENMADYMEKKRAEAKPSDTRKRIDEVNAARQSAGQARLTPAEEAKTLQQGLDSSIAPRAQQLPANQQVNIATTTDRLKETGKTATIATQQLSTLNQLEQLNDTAFAGRGSGVELKVKQFLDFAGFPVGKGVSATEAFNSVVKNAQLNAQTMLKGSSSDRDMEIVSQTGPQLENTKNGRKLMISSAKYKAKIDQQYNAFLNAWQNKNSGSLDGADEQWNKFVQSRRDFDKKNLTFDSNAINEKSWSPFLDPSYSSTSGKSYTLSGKPFDMEAAIKATGLSEEEIVKQAGLQ